MLALAAGAAVLAGIVAGPASPAAPQGFGAPSCLRGSWVANQTETRRVLRALVPVEGLSAKGALYMIFRDGNFQYGSRALQLTFGRGALELIGRASFFTLMPYTARRGVVTFGVGESTIEYGKMTGIKDGRSYSVAGPPPKTTRVPGGSAPFQCRDATLRMKLPRFASLEWITLRRGTP